MAATAAKLAIGGYEFQIVEEGHGQPVLFVHGSVSDHRTWQPQVGAFAARFRAVAYSRRYHWPECADRGRRRLCDA
jgi:pimeloyl-ACP methyl ester carboxylesterase